MARKRKRSGKSRAKGQRVGFKAMTRKLAARKGVRNPKALAAYIGRKKYGKKGMAKKAAAGRRKAARRRKRKR